MKLNREGMTFMNRILVAVLSLGLAMPTPVFALDALKAINSPVPEESDLARDLLATAAGVRSEVRNLTTQTEISISLVEVLGQIPVLPDSIVKAAEDKLEELSKTSKDHAIGEFIVMGLGNDLYFHVMHKLGEDNAWVEHLVLEATKAAIVEAHKLSLIDKDTQAKYSDLTTISKLAMNHVQVSRTKRSADPHVIAVIQNADLPMVIPIVRKMIGGDAQGMQSLTAIEGIKGFRVRLRHIDDIRNGKKDGYVLELNTATDLEDLTNVLMSQEWIPFEVFPPQGGRAAGDEPALKVSIDQAYSDGTYRPANIIIHVASQGGIWSVGEIARILSDPIIGPGGLDAGHYKVLVPVGLQQAKARPANPDFATLTLYGFQAAEWPEDGQPRMPKIFDYLASTPDVYRLKVEDAQKAADFLRRHRGFPIDVTDKHARVVAEGFSAKLKKLFSKIPLLQKDKIRDLANRASVAVFSLFKADVGGDPGHTISPWIYFSAGRGAAKAGVDSGLFIDAKVVHEEAKGDKLFPFGTDFVGGAGDDIQFIAVHKNGLNSVEVHSFFMKAFLAMGVIAKWIGEDPYGWLQDIVGPEITEQISTNDKLDMRKLETVAGINTDIGKSIVKHVLADLEQAAKEGVLVRHQKDYARVIEDRFQKAISEQVAPEAADANQVVDAQQAKPYSGNVQGMGPGWAELPLKSLTNVVVASEHTDKTGPAFFNIPTLKMVEEAFESGAYSNGFVFEIYDTIDHNRIFLDLETQRQEIYGLLGDVHRFNIKRVFEKVKRGWQVNASRDINILSRYIDPVHVFEASTEKLAIITGGEYRGKDDAVSVQTLAMNQFFKRKVTLYTTQGNARGSFMNIPRPSRLREAVATDNSRAIQVNLEHALTIDGKISVTRDVFASDEYAPIRQRVEKENKELWAMSGILPPVGPTPDKVEPTYPVINKFVKVTGELPSTILEAQRKKLDHAHGEKSQHAQPYSTHTTDLFKNAAEASFRSEAREIVEEYDQVTSWEKAFDKARELFNAKEIDAVATVSRREFESGVYVVPVIRGEGATLGLTDEEYLDRLARISEEIYTDNATFRLFKVTGRVGGLPADRESVPALVIVYLKPGEELSQRAEARDAAVRVAINGAGRIGVNFIRAWLQRESSNVEVVAINDLAFKLEQADSADEAVVSRNLKQLDAFITSLEREFDTRPRSTLVNKVIFLSGRDNQGYFIGLQTSLANVHKIYVTSVADPAALPWKALNVDVALESTGRFTDAAQAGKHLTAGAKKVVISAPAKGQLTTVVAGVNHELLNDTVDICSGASCTTGAIAPVLKTLQDTIGIDAFYTPTTHARTADQAHVDTLRPEAPARGIPAPENIILTSTGAAKAIGEVIPALKGKGDGMALRVPTADGSIVPIVVEASRATTKDEVNSVLKDAARILPFGVLAFEDKGIDASIDILGRTESSIVAGRDTSVSANGKLVVVYAWYDNEFGYANRALDLVGLIGKPARSEARLDQDAFARAIEALHIPANKDVRINFYPGTIELENRSKQSGEDRILGKVVVKDRIPQLEVLMNQFNGVISIESKAVSPFHPDDIYSIVQMVLSSGLKPRQEILSKVFAGTAFKVQLINEDESDVELPYEGVQVLVARSEVRAELQKVQGIDKGAEALRNIIDQKLAAGNQNVVVSIFGLEDKGPNQLMERLAQGNIGNWVPRFLSTVGYMARAVDFQADIAYTFQTEGKLNPLNFFIPLDSFGNTPGSYVNQTKFSSDLASALKVHKVIVVAGEVSEILVNSFLPKPSSVVRVRLSSGLNIDENHLANFIAKDVPADLTVVSQIGQKREARSEARNIIGINNLRQAVLKIVASSHPITAFYVNGIQVQAANPAEIPDAVVRQVISTGQNTKDHVYSISGNDREGRYFVSASLVVANETATLDQLAEVINRLAAQTAVKLPNGAMIGTGFRLGLLTLGVVEVNNGKVSPNLGQSAFEFLRQTSLNSPDVKFGVSARIDQFGHGDIVLSVDSPNHTEEELFPARSEAREVTDEEILSAITESISRIAEFTSSELSKLGLEDDLQVKYGLDSIDLADLSADLEEKFSIRLSADDAGDWRTVRNVVEAVQAAAANRSEARLADDEVQTIEFPPLLGAFKQQIQEALAAIIGIYRSDARLANQVFAVQGLNITKGTLVDPAMLFQEGYLVYALALSEWAKGPVAVVLDPNKVQDYRAAVRILNEINDYLVSEGKNPFLVTGSLSRALNVMEEQFQVKEFQAVVKTESAFSTQIVLLRRQIEIITERMLMKLMSLDSRLARFVQIIQQTYYAVAKSA